MSLSLSGDGTVTGVTAIGDVSSTELGYLDGVTSALQTQINTKADASTQGLVLIDEESFSAVSSVSLNNVFSATYQNYAIAIFLTSATSAQLRMKLRNAGSDLSASNYLYNNQGLTDGGTEWNQNGAGSSAGYELGYTNGSHTYSALIHIFGPNSTNAPNIFGQAQCFNSAGGSFSRLDIGGKYNTTATGDGFSLLLSTGTMTGTVRTYGYKGA